jgi:hypothetical protein
MEVFSGETHMSDTMVTPESVVAGPQPLVTEEERLLTAVIASTWSAHRVAKTTANRTKTELAAIRGDLAANLHSMKGILVRTGRGGGWASFLRHQQIPRATADRAVQRHELVLSPAGNCLAEALSGMEAVESFAHHLLPRLRKMLTSAADFQCFVRTLAVGMEAASVQENTDGLLVLSS